MNTPEEGAPLASDDNLEQAVERILGNALPRAVPSAEEEAMVRETVKAEWLALTNRRKSSRRLKSFAIAASVLVVVFAGFNSVRMAGVSETPVASIDKRFGSIYMLGENSELLESNNVSTVTAGQTVITDEDSGIGIAWGAGGSLRIDEDSRVEFVSDESIYLRSGRVYFDSRPAIMAGKQPAAAKLTILTDHGDITHVGTQYMARADGSMLTISVREGEVRLAGRAGAESASGGQQLQIRDGVSASIVNIKPYGESWQWVEQMSPTTIVNGRSVHEFLVWVSHETGMSLEFASEDIEVSARDEILVGTVDTDPTSALRIWMLGTDLEWNIDDGVILVGRNVGRKDQESEIRQ